LTIRVGATAVGGGKAGWGAVVGVGLRVGVGFGVGGGKTVGVGVGSAVGVGVGLGLQPATRRNRIANRVMSFLFVMLISILILRLETSERRLSSRRRIAALLRHRKSSERGAVRITRLASS